MGSLERWIIRQALQKIFFGEERKDAQNFEKFYRYLVIFSVIIYSLVFLYLKKKAYRIRQNERREEKKGIDDDYFADKGEGFRLGEKKKS